MERETEIGENRREDIDSRDFRRMISRSACELCPWS